MDGGRLAMGHARLIIAPHLLMRHQCPLCGDTGVRLLGADPPCSFGTVFAPYQLRNITELQETDLPITAPRISVSTRGPREWLVAVRQLSIAEGVRDNLQLNGLTCGEIDADGNGFVFTVKMRCVTTSASVHSAVGKGVPLQRMW